MSAHVLVTGGNSGIGLATAKRLIENGYSVTISGRNEERISEAAANLGCEGFVADMGVAEDVARLVQHFEGKALFGVVNNAAIARFVPLEFSTPEFFQEIMDINVRGPLDLIKGLLPQLEKGKGSIVNISSAIVNNGLPNAAYYAATKGAIDAVTKSLAIELAPKGIRVNAISPGAIDTPIITKLGIDEEMQAAVKAQQEASIPLRRLGNPEELAQAIVAQLESTYTTGAIWAVDGGVNAQ